MRTHKEEKASATTKQMEASGRQNRGTYRKERRFYCFQMRVRFEKVSLEELAFPEAGRRPSLDHIGQVETEQ
jgi:hypothetical protein